MDAFGPSELAGARCAVHPALPAVAVCERCGSYACIDCHRLVEDRAVCAGCVSRVRRGDYGSWVAIASGICAFLGLGCAPLAPLAIAMAAFDLGRIATKTAPKGGLKVDLIAIAIGALGTIVWIAVIVQMVSSTGSDGSELFGDDVSGW